MMRTRLLAAMFFTGAFIFAQSAEFGGMIGGGAFGVSSGSAAGRGQVGMDACLFCSGRFGLFGEYSHWFSGSAGQSGLALAAGTSNRVSSADLGGAGLRIQSRGQIRVFFDIGGVAGRDEHIGAGGGAIGGIMAGSGVEIAWRQHWYIRPQVRVYALSPHSIEAVGIHWAVSGGAGVGYRF